MIYRGIDDSSFGLTHHGIKGMKWGVRKKISAKSNARKKNRAIKKQRSYEVRQRRRMTDDQLKTRINRMRLEQQYKDAVMQDQAPVRYAIRKGVSSAIGDFGNNGVKAAARIAIPAGLAVVAARSPKFKAHAEKWKNEYGYPLEKMAEDIVFGRKKK